MNTKENVAEMWIIVIRQISIIAIIISQTIMFHLENANVIVRTHGWLRLVPLSISKPFQIRICNKFKHTSVNTWLVSLGSIRNEKHIFAGRSHLAAISRL